MDNKPKHVVLVYRDGEELSVLANMLDDGYLIHQVNETSNSIVYILCKGCLK